jgi:hypothetical protein
MADRLFARPFRHVVRLPGVLLVTMFAAAPGYAAMASAQDLAQPGAVRPEAAAAEAQRSAPLEASPFTLHGPPPPIAPAVLTRDDNGRATMRAVRVREAMRIDGRLDEEIYASVPGAGDFIQQDPDEGEPAVAKTEAWLFFDDRNIYVAARCWDDLPPERWVVNELQRDGNVSQDDSFNVVLDTFHDHRNGFMFQSSPLSVIRDQAFTDEGNLNESWNTVWDVRSAPFDGGWTIEFAIPFKSLRYRGSGPQVWSVNFRRIVRSTNEFSLLTRVPAAYGPAGHYRMSLAADLVGLETPAQSINLELKPYVLSTLTTNRVAPIPLRNDLDGNGGFDLKYGVTRSLIADFTYNTDFAQVEEDLQQVNLTRFSLFFPEKREFFLEGQGIFSFGGVGTFGGGGGGGASDVPILFFSRRIGLNQGQPVPVLAGGRLTGKIGAFDVGLLNIQSDDEPEANAVSTNFSVVRLKRDILRRSNIGILATRRTPNVDDRGANLSYGADANLSFFNTVSVNAYYARTDSPGRDGDQASYRGRFDYNSDRYGLQAEYLSVGDDFNPEIGFTRRTDFRRSSAMARFSPRPRRSRLIRKLNWQANYDYITNAKGDVLENTLARGLFRIDFNNSDLWTFQVTREHEHLDEEFEIFEDILLPVGGYDWTSYATTYNFGPQRKIYGRLNLEHGTFYGGYKTEASWGGGRINVSPHLTFEPGITVNWVDLPEGYFESVLVTTRANVTPSSRMSISALTQYNADARTLSSSARLRWEYVPGSELFVVYTDGRATGGGQLELMSRALAVKITRLVRF